MKYLGAACALGTCAVLSYYLLDVFHAGFPWTGGAQTVRIFLASTCVLVAAFCFANVSRATRYYGPIFSGTVTVIIATACVTSYMLHSTEPRAALIWGTERTLILCVVVVAGFSRLTAISTIVVVSVVPIAMITLISITARRM